MKEKKLVAGGMTVKTYKVLERCIDDGVSYGWNRAHKHDDNPNEAHIREQIQNAIMNEICEWFNFDDDL